MKEFKKDKLKVKIYNTRNEMGIAAAEDITQTVNKLIHEKGEINMVFAAAPSQNEVLKAFVESDIDFKKINAFHMDEYVGLNKEHPQSFGYFLRESIFGKAPFKNVYYISDYGLEYDKLLATNHIDIVVLGIGENGHIAFNDPDVADFNDELRIKKVQLDDICRQQQVNDGCFPTFDDVPKHALTLTIPQMTSADYMFCIVPGPTKRNAVTQTVNGNIEEKCPASILRTHNNAILYLDLDSGADLA